MDIPITQYAVYSKTEQRASVAEIIIMLKCIYRVTRDINSLWVGRYLV